MAANTHCAGADCRRWRWSPLSSAWSFWCAGSPWVEVCEGLAEQTGLGSSFIGATLLATTTSLPEHSTTIAAVRMGAYTMAISNISGSNLIMVLVLFPADIFYRDGLTLNQVDGTAKLALLSGILVTAIYMIGLLVRRKPRVFGIGLDSLIVLIVYAVTGLGILRGAVISEAIAFPGAAIAAPGDPARTGSNVRELGPGSLRVRETITLPVPRPRSRQLCLVAIEEDSSCFEHSIECDEYFSGCCDEGDLAGEAACFEVSIELCEPVGAAGRGDGGHVEVSADLSASSLDGSLSASDTAIIVEGSDAGEGGDGAPGELSEFGHHRNEGRGGDGSDAGNGGDEFVVLVGCFSFGDKRLDAALDVFDGAGEPLDVISEVLSEIGLRGLFETGFLLGPHTDELSPSAPQGLKFPAFRTARGVGARLQALPHFGQHAGVDPVGLGQVTAGLREGAGLRRVDPGEGPTAGFQCSP